MKKNSRYEGDKKMGYTLIGIRVVAGSSAAIIAL